METKEDYKEIKIVAPEGYEIDRGNSTIERILFKRKKDGPKTWEEFCKRGFTGEEAFIGISGVLKSRCTKGEDKDTSDVGYVGNVQEAEAFIALMQLRQLRKTWVNTWEPDWKDNNYKYVIEVYSDDIQVYSYTYTSQCLSFPTREMAVEFMDCFKGLLEQAKILL